MNELLSELLLLSKILLGMIIINGFLIIIIKVWMKNKILPKQRFRSVPWDIQTIFLVLILFIFSPIIVSSILHSTNFFQIIYGLDFPSKFSNNGNDVEREAAVLIGLWTALFASPIVLFSIAAHLYLYVNAQSIQLGLSPKQIFEGIIIGALGACVIIPAVFIIHGCSILGYFAITGELPQPHPLASKLSKWSSGPEQILLFIVAVIFAPILEELIFRGIIQPWCMNKITRPHIIFIIAVFLTIIIGSTNSKLSDQQGPVGLILFVSIIYIITLIKFSLNKNFNHLKKNLNYHSKEQVYLAIMASSILFAGFHTSVWPTPIPLFAFGIAVGYTAYRTQSIVAPVTLHSLLNCISWLVLINKS